MPGDSPNFPQTNPQDQSQQYQKQFFPFKAFQFDDPNVTNPPTLTLSSPWLMKASGTFSGTGTGLTNAVCDTAANLASSNPVLLKGQIGYETDTKYFKIGDGSTAYNSLSYQWKAPYVDPSTKAPLPQSASGVGQWEVFNGGAPNTALNLPAGGTWAYFSWISNLSTGTSGGWNAGIAAGGTQIQAASPSNTGVALAWRIA